MHESFLLYASRRYLKWALALAAAATVVYAWHDPLSPPNGGTWLGYTLGGIGAALILWLTALGIRKRSYRSSLGTVQGWVSAHVYLGLALLVVATLHTGFQFGWNIHTLCYVLMVIVIASGIVGVVLYRAFPQEMSKNRAEQTPERLWQEIVDLDQRALRAAAALPGQFADAIRSNRDRTRVGGGARAILSARDRSQIELIGADGVLRISDNPGQSRLLDWLAAELAASTDGERTRQISGVVDLIAARRLALRRLQRDARIRGWLEVWLFVHVPVTFGLLGTLIAHVVSVFLYW